MSHPRPVIVVGVSDRQRVEALRKATREAGLELEDVPTAEQAKGWLDSGDPAAILVNVAYDAAEPMCLFVRSHPRFSSVPVVGLTSELNDLSFAEVYGWGGDDVTRIDVPADLVPRLRLSVSDRAVHEPTKPRGLAVVADADRRRRIIVARVLHNAGFDVRFAVEAEEADRASRGENVALVVLGADLGPEGPAAVVQHLRSTNLEVPCIVTLPPRKISAARSALKELKRVAITDAFAPPENVLFCANELSREGLTDGRASPRILYGTMVAFRLAGRDEDSFGFTYNVSAGGLYVRTLSGPAAGEDTWLELRPPRSDRRVRLEAKVAWRRRFGPIDAATVPAGFGVQITDATKGDMERYLTGYQAFRGDVLGLPSVIPTK